MPKKILVIDDNRQNRELLEIILKHYGYDVINAVNGREGINSAKENKPDLILMDIHMPVMDGITAMNLLKEDPRTRDIKVIAITSFAMKEDAEKILKEGFADYITKPIDAKTLPEVIRRHLEGEDEKIRR